jgi:hypothetical protein
MLQWLEGKLMAYRIELKRRHMKEYRPCSYTRHKHIANKTSLGPHTT